MGEVGGAIERVDTPLQLARAGAAAAFLRQHPHPRGAFAQDRQHRRFGGLIGLGADSTVQNKQSEFNDLGCSTVAGAARNAAQCNSLKKEGERATSTRTAGWVMAGVGGAAVLGGLAWWYFGSKAPAKKTAWQLTPGPTVAGLGLAGSF